MSAEPKPSATVVLIRDADDDLELLLLQRSSRKRDKPGPWVFPGGKVEATDIVGDAEELEHHARRAAVRETGEEANLVLSEADLVMISRWITPELAPRRFDTWFFLGTVGPDAAVEVDDAEMCAHRWLSPRSALAAHETDEIRLAPPTFVTVTWLLDYVRCSDATEALGRGPIMTFRPRICPTPKGACILYPGDIGYETGDTESPGARHRLWSHPNGFHYERSD